MHSKIQLIILLILIPFLADTQAGINIQLVNRELSGNTWSFDLQASASASYTAPDNNNWQAFNIRFDVVVPAGITVIAGNASMNNTYTASGGTQLTPAGTPPAGSIDIGITGTRTTQTDLTSSAVILGSYSFTFSGPVNGADFVTPRTSTGGTGSFWSNTVSGSRPFNLPAAFPLPITIKSFSATKDGERSSRLDWTSSSEINSDYIGIERSTDGEDWTTVGQVKAAGNSNRDIDYIYYDRSLPMARSIDNIFYYRLKLTDLDGQYKYSETRGVNMGRLEGLVSIYPNPATDIINVDLTDMDLHEGIIHLSVYDNTGKAIISKEVNGAGIEPIQASNMAAGTYNVVVKQGDTTHRKQIIVVN